MIFRKAKYSLFNQLLSLYLLDEPFTLCTELYNCTSIIETQYLHLSENSQKKIQNNSTVIGKLQVFLNSLSANLLKSVLYLSCFVALSVFSDSCYRSELSFRWVSQVVFSVVQKRKITRNILKSKQRNEYRELHFRELFHFKLCPAGGDLLQRAVLHLLSQQVIGNEMRRYEKGSISCN